MSRMRAPRGAAELVQRRRLSGRVDAHDGRVRAEQRAPDGAVGRALDRGPRDAQVGVARGGRHRGGGRLPLACAQQRLRLVLRRPAAAARVGRDHRRRAEALVHAAARRRPRLRSSPPGRVATRRSPTAAGTHVFFVHLGHVLQQLDRRAALALSAAVVRAPSTAPAARRRRARPRTVTPRIEQLRPRVIAALAAGAVAATGDTIPRPSAVQICPVTHTRAHSARPPMHAPLSRRVGTLMTCRTSIVVASRSSSVLANCRLTQMHPGCLHDKLRLCS